MEKKAKNLYYKNKEKGFKKIVMSKQKLTAQEIAERAFAGMPHINTVWVDEQWQNYYLHDMSLRTDELHIPNLQKFERPKSNIQRWLGKIGKG